MKNFGSSLILFLALSISACGPNYIVEKELPITAGEWSYDQQLDFDFEIEDSLKLYNLLLDINYEKIYPKQNLYLRIHSLFPEREPIAQVLSIDLMDKMGRHQGDCNEAACTVEILLQKEAYFNTLGKHTIRLEQFMRINPLPGIKSMTLKVEDTGKQR